MQFRMLRYRATLSRLRIQITEYSPSTLKSSIATLESVPGILQVQFDSEKNNLKILFNSGQISENGVMHQFHKTPLKGEKTQGILEQEKALYDEEIRHRKRLLILSIIFTIPIFIIGQLMMNTQIFMDMSLLPVG